MAGKAKELRIEQRDADGATYSQPRIHLQSLKDFEQESCAHEQRQQHEQVGNANRIVGNAGKNAGNAAQAEC